MIATRIFLPLPSGSIVLPPAFSKLGFRRFRLRHATHPRLAAETALARAAGTHTERCEPRCLLRPSSAAPEPGDDPLHVPEVRALGGDRRAAARQWRPAGLL